MPVAYFDASALLKLILTEDGSDLADSLWDSSNGVLSSRLTYPEVRAALAAAHRNHRLTDSDLLEAEAGWEAIWLRMRPIDLTEDVERHAGDLAGGHALRGADAVHLASALAVAEADLIVAVWDWRLHAACLAAGLSVVPANLS